MEEQEHPPDLFLQPQQKKARRTGEHPFDEGFMGGGGGGGGAANNDNNAAAQRTFPLDSPLMAADDIFASGLDFGSSAAEGAMQEGGAAGAGAAGLDLFAMDADNDVLSMLRSYDQVYEAGAEKEGEAGQQFAELKKSFDALEDEFKGVEWELKNFIPPLAPESFQALNSRLHQLMKALKVSWDSTEKWIDSNLLHPSQYASWQELISSHRLLHAQTQVYKEELKAIHENVYPASGIGALLITMQPFPNVIKQKEKRRAKQSGQGDEPLEVKVLMGARIGVEVEGKVTAEVVYENYKAGSSNKGRQTGSIINGDSRVAADGTATFAQLRFSKGTGVKIVRLRFSCTALATNAEQMPGGDAEFTLESALSAPFIVMTNESQFSDSAGKLLRQEAFGPTGSEITWARLANLLQLHYLISTRQQLHQITRPLTRSDLAYIWSSQFGESDTLSKKSFEAMWKWFGKVLHKIRHQKPIPEMWEKGYVFGFIPKKDATQILVGHGAGTFLVRFSERSAGQFAIAYVLKDKASGNLTVKHYLVPQSTKKLSDFLRSKDVFRQVLLCNSSFDAKTYAEMSKGTMSKDGAFGDFYTHEDAPQLEGYDDLNE